MRFVIKSLITLFFIFLSFSIGYADSLATYAVPDFLSLPEGADTGYDLIELNFTKWDFEYNISGDHWLYMDGCDDDYTISGGWEVTNISCLSTDFLNKTNLLDKTIVEVIHAFNVSGIKETMSAILSVDDDGYYHAFLQYASAPKSTGIRYFLYIPYMIKEYTVDGTPYYTADINFLHLGRSEHGLTQPTKRDAPTKVDSANISLHKAQLLWYNNTVFYPEYICNDNSPPNTCPHGNPWCQGHANCPFALQGLKIGNATFAWSMSNLYGAAVFESHRFWEMGLIVSPEDSISGGAHTIFYMDNGATGNKAVLVDDLTHTNNGGCGYSPTTVCNWVPFDKQSQYYKRIEGIIYAEYLDSNGVGINSATCTAIRDNPYALASDNTPSPSKVYDVVELINTASGIYTTSFNSLANVEYPTEGHYMYNITCAKPTYATLSRTLDIWVGETGGYQDSERFRIVSMEGVFDTVSAYDEKGNLLDISTLTKKQKVDQVLFKIWERDNGFINNQMFAYNEDIQERHERFKNADDYADYINMAKDHYAVGVRLYSSDFYCNGNGLAYSISPASTYAGYSTGDASLMHIGGASFGYSSTQARNTFCLGVFSFQGFITWLPTVGSAYRYPINICKGFTCYEPAEVFMQIMVCEEGSIADCKKPHYLPLITFNYGFGNMEFRYPQVININSSTQSFYGRLFDASKGNPMVLEDINCTVNITGSDSTIINVGRLERYKLDALAKEFTPTAPQYNASQYNYSLYCIGDDEFYNPLYQTGIVYVGDMLLEQSRCEVIPDKFKPNTYVTTICELASSNAVRYSLDNFTIQYNISVGNQSVIQNMTSKKRTAQLIYEYTDLNYYRNQTTTGLEALEDGEYTITIWGWDNNGNYPSFNTTMFITIDSTIIDISEYLVAVYDNVPKKGYYSTGDNYTCTVIWKDPDKELYKAEVEIGTISTGGDIFTHVFLYTTYYQRGWDLPFDISGTPLEDIYDLANYDLRTDTYSLTYFLYYPLDVCKERGTYKVYNASSFEESDVFLDDVCEYFPLQKRDNIRCTWTLEFGSNLSSVGGSKFVQHPFRRLSTIDLWSFLSSIIDKSGMGKLFGDIINWIKSNILGFFILIILIIVVAIFITSRNGGGEESVIYQVDVPVSRSRYDEFRSDY